MIDARRVYCFELDKVFNSIHEAARFINADYTQILRVCKGESSRKTVKGYHFCYEEDRSDLGNGYLSSGYNKRIKATNIITGETLVFDTRKEACSALGVSPSNIYAVLKGLQTQSHGWSFSES